MQLFDPVVVRAREGVRLQQSGSNAIAIVAVFAACVCGPAVAVWAALPQAAQVLMSAVVAASACAAYQLVQWIRPIAFLEGDSVWIRRIWFFGLRLRRRQLYREVPLIGVGEVVGDGGVLILGRDRLYVGRDIDIAVAEIAAVHARVHGRALDATQTRGGTARSASSPPPTRYEGQGLWRPGPGHQVLAGVGVVGAVCCLLSVASGPIPAASIQRVVPGLVCTFVPALGYLAWVLFHALKPGQTHAAELLAAALVVQRGDQIQEHPLREIRSVHLDNGIVIARTDGTFDRFGAGWPPRAQRALHVALADSIQSAARAGS